MSSVLIIDDEPMIQKLLGRFFEMEGYDVFKASNGKEGLDIYYEHHPDLIVTDILMPEKDGLETIMEVRKEDQNVKIIAISGGGVSDPDDYLKMAKAFGADRTISKPVLREDLLKVAKDLIK